jgi:hypothetical protein
MLTVDVKARADMTEVILCLSAIYSGRPLPPRKRAPKKKENEANGLDGGTEPKVGAYRTDGQGIQKTAVEEPKKPAEAKKLDPNSAAARRKRAVIQSVGTEKTKFEASFSELFNNKGGDGAADPFGQTVTYNDGEPLSLSAMGGGGGGGGGGGVDMQAHFQHLMPQIYRRHLQTERTTTSMIRLISKRSQFLISSRMPSTCPPIS